MEEIELTYRGPGKKLICFNPTCPDFQKHVYNGHFKDGKCKNYKSVEERWKPPTDDEDGWGPTRPNKPVDIDPNEFNPRKGIMTRYGKKLLEEGAKHYGKVSIFGQSRPIEVPEAGASDWTNSLPKINKEYPDL